MSTLDLLAATDLGLAIPGKLDTSRDPDHPGTVRVGFRLVGEWTRQEGEDHPKDAPLARLDAIVPGLSAAMDRVLEDEAESVAYKAKEGTAHVIRLADDDEPITARIEYVDVKASRKRVKLTARVVLLSVGPDRIADIIERFSADAVTIQSAQLDMFGTAAK